MLLSDIINYSIYGVAALFVLIIGLLGFMRGIGKQTVFFVAVGASIFLAYLISVNIYPYLQNLLKDNSISEFCALFGVNFTPELANLVDCIDSATASYIIALPLTVVVVPVLFVLLAFIISGIFIIPCFLICGILGFGRKYNNLYTRIGGAAVGAIEGFIIAAVLLIPVVGIADVCGDAVKLAETEHPDSENTISISQLYHDNLDKAESNFIYQFVDGQLGYIYDQFTIIDMDGCKVEMDTVAEDFFEIFVLYGDLGSDVDFNRLTPENKEVFDSIVDSFAGDYYMTSVVSGATRSISNAIVGGNIILEVEEPLGTFMRAVISVFETSTPENVDDDLRTILQIYYDISDAGVLASMELKDKTMFEAFVAQDESGNSLVSLICSHLNENPRFNVVSTSLSDFAMEMLFNHLDVDGTVAETVTEVKGSLNEIVKLDKDSYETEEEYKADVSLKIDDTLKNNGIELESDQLAEITDYVINEFEGKEEITDMDMALFMSKYYDIYGKYPELGDDGEIPDLDDLPVDGDTAE